MLLNMGTFSTKGYSEIHVVILTVMDFLMLSTELAFFLDTNAVDDKLDIDRPVREYS